jgi:hypothetical protein
MVSNSGFTDIVEALRSAALGRMLVSYETPREDLACIDNVSDALWCALRKVYGPTMDEHAEGRVQDVLACFAGHTLIGHRTSETRAMHLGLVDLADVLMAQVVAPYLAPEGVTLCSCNRAWLPEKFGTRRNMHRMHEGHVFDGCCA